MTGEPNPQTEQSHQPPTNGEQQPDPDAEPLGSPWHDLRAYAATPRLQALALSPDGRTLLVSMAQLNHDQTGYVTGWWSVDPHGHRPAHRVTRSSDGEAAAAFLTDNSLIFGSGRAAPPAGKQYGPKPATEPTDDDGVLWCLPAAGGEAYPIARRYGGFEEVAAARRADRLVLMASAFPGTETEADDQAQRKLRKTKKVSAVLHDGYPVRYWDHDLGTAETRLFGADLGGRSHDPDGTEPRIETDDLRRLAPGAGRKLDELQALADDGSFAIAGWLVPRQRGISTSGLAELDIDTGGVTVRAEEEAANYGGAQISPDNNLIAAAREPLPTAEQAPTIQLVLIDRTTGQQRQLAPEWDRWPQPCAFSPDSATLYVVADEDGDAPIFAVDVATGAVRRLTGGGSYGSVLLSVDGSTLYAIRSSYVDPGTIVAIGTADGVLTELPGPVSYPDLPGRLVDVETTVADGSRVRGYLALPSQAGAENPAPLALWIHGGPLSSWNAWSWRWCPWLLVSRGYAVLLPDPALSTGYGQQFVQRGWGRWGAEPYTDLMEITDAVRSRGDVDGDDMIAMGGSFGGYMANWVAGHTDRFSAIVTHASLWNLESFRFTTDNGIYWLNELSDQMVADYSPHRFAGRITTPMLVIHGDRDYRVPISEGLGLWATLLSEYDNDPQTMPHKFLYFPNENHWVLSPQDAIVWYETVLEFLQAARTGGNFCRPRVL